MGEKTCRVFTPPAIVNYMLNKIEYSDNLTGKKILENSCGTGRFLCEIVRRYIVDARRNGKTNEEIRRGLETDICGIEKERDIYFKCKENLDHVAADLGIMEVEWDLRLGDALQIDYGSDYQYVVGNPPYITYYNLSEQERKEIRDNFSVCRKGKADYYYAFTEAALNALAPDGIMAYLIPNNFMKNRDSSALRQHILPYLTVLEDFKFEKIFENYQTSSAIIICSKKDMQEEFWYIDREENSGRMIRKEGLEGKWIFDYAATEKHHARRLGDCFRVSAPVATLLNEAFVIKDYTEGDKWIEAGGLRLEREGLRPAASPKSEQYQENNYIIFPYYYEEERCFSYEPMSLS